jgi:ABC-type molybdate transport system substrate-binding protein
MAWLAQSSGSGELGITQVTEILPNKGVAYAGPLPDEFQMKAVYSIGLAANAPQRALAEDFIARFRVESAKALLKEAGYELG